MDFSGIILIPPNNIWHNCTIVSAQYNQRHPAINYIHSSIKSTADSVSDHCTSRHQPSRPLWTYTTSMAFPPNNDTDSNYSPSLLTSLSSTSDYWLNQATQKLPIPFSSIYSKPKPAPITTSSSNDDETTLWPDIPSDIFCTQPLHVSPLSIMGDGMSDAARMNYDEFSSYATRSATKAAQSPPKAATSPKTPASASKATKSPSNRSDSPFNISRDEMQSVIEKTNQTYMMQFEKKIEAKNQQMQEESKMMQQEFLKQVMASIQPLIANAATGNATAPNPPPVEQVQVSDTNTTSNASKNDSTLNGQSTINQEEEDDTATATSTFASNQSTTSHPVNTETTIPVTSKIDLKYDEPVQHIQWHSYKKYITPHLPSDEEVEIRGIDVAEAFIRAAKLVVPNHDLKLISVREPLLDTKAASDDVRISGQFVIALQKPGSLSFDQQLLELKRLAHLTIVSKVHHELVYDDLPKYLPACTYSLPAVNFSDSMPCAVIFGMPSSWIDTKDAMAKDRLLDEIVQSAIRLSPPEKEIPSILKEGVKLRDKIGFSHYSSSQVKIDGKNGQIMALYYAKNDEGEEAAKVLLDVIGDQSINIFGDLYVSLNVFPKRGENSRSKRPTRNALQAFTQETIRGNHDYCVKKYKAYRVDNATEAVFVKEITDELSLCMQNAVAALPRAEKGKKEGKLKYSFMFVLLNNPSTSMRNSAYYEKHIKKNIMPEIFVEDSEFKEVEKKQAAPKTTEQKKSTVNKESLSKKLDSAASLSRDSGKRWCAIRFGRGGRRAVGVWQWWGRGNARWLTQGISGARYKSFATKAEAWAWINEAYPEVYDEKTCEEFWTRIPHTETNLSPTFSMIDGKIFHRADATAYTFCESDDEKLLTIRMKVTKDLTGSEDGPINERSHYFATSARTFTSDDMELEEEEEIPSSQDAWGGPPPPQPATPPRKESAHRLSTPEGDKKPSALPAKDTPKKRKLDSDVAKAPNQGYSTSDDPDVLKHYHFPVIIKTPPHVCRFDIYGYLQGFSGRKFSLSEVNSCVCAYFSGYGIAVDVISDEEAIQLQTWIHRTRLYGKCLMATWHCKKRQDYDCTKGPSIDLEIFAQDAIVQYVKSEVEVDQYDEVALFLTKKPNPQQFVMKLLTTWKVPEDLEILDAAPPKPSPTGADGLDHENMATEDRTVNLNADEENLADLGEAHMEDNDVEIIEGTQDEGDMNVEKLSPGTKAYVESRQAADEFYREYDELKALGEAHMDEEYHQMMAAKELVDKSTGNSTMAEELADTDDDKTPNF